MFVLFHAVFVEFSAKSLRLGFIIAIAISDTTLSSARIANVALIGLPITNLGWLVGRTRSGERNDCLNGMHHFQGGCIHATDPI
jgi:hypothetical protein